MLLTVMKSKIHRATVTEADLSYEGSISLDPDLIKQARFNINEKVDIYNCNSGARFSTYVIEGGKGQVCLNGAAARMVQPGDIVIIVCYGIVDEKEAAKHKPTVVFVDQKNRVKELRSEDAKKNKKSKKA